MVNKMHLTLVALCTLMLLALATATPSVGFSTTNSAGYNIDINGMTIFSAADTGFTAFNTSYSIQKNTLLFAGMTQYNGTDSIGTFAASVYTYKTTSNGITWEVKYRLYSTLATQPNGNSNTIRAIVFEQNFVTGLSGSATSHDDSISSFPSFQFMQPKGINLLYHQFNGGMLGDGYSNPWGSKSDDMRSGIRAGPLVLYDALLSFSVVIAPLTQFMDTVVVKTANAVKWGIQGDVNTVPADYSIETMIYFSDDGISNGIVEWGDIMLHRYGKVRAVAVNDLPNKYLGYSTANGAYYYYNQEPGQNYENTMIDVHTYIIDELQMPFRFMHYDSWRYFHYKNISNNGVVDWNARPDIFPDGGQFVHNQLRLPLMAHNKWWSRYNVYAKENGGQYDFVLETTYAVPTDAKFWIDLFSNASTIWGLRTYEQDWLSVEADEMRALSNTIGLGRQWLTQMGQGASMAGVSIQYCMATPRQVLETLENTAVTSFRASADYLSANAQDQWRIGMNSAFGWAIAVMPYKDNYRSTSVQPDNKTEPNPDLQSVIVTLSMAPVTPSDGIGFMNTSLVMRSIRSDGAILRPDRSAMSIDASWISSADSSLGISGEATHTYTEFNGYQWHIILTAQQDNVYTLTTKDVHIDTTLMVYRYNMYSLSLPLLTVFSPTSPIEIAKASRDNFSVWYGAPVFSNGIVLLGETTKWVPVSHQRIVSMDVNDNNLILSLIGGSDETVVFQWGINYQNYWYVMSVSCTLNGLGAGVLTIFNDVKVAANCN